VGIYRLAIGQPITDLFIGVSFFLIGLS